MTDTQEISSEISAFINEEQLTFSGGPVADMLRISQYVKSQKRLWREFQAAVPKQDLLVLTLRLISPYMTLIGVPPGATIPLHTHGQGVYGVSGILTGELIEANYAVEGNNRVMDRTFRRVTAHHGFDYQPQGHMHGVGNIERDDAALVLECWMPSLNFTLQKLQGRSVLQRF